jgi:hypothetical protein
LCRATAALAVLASLVTQVPLSAQNASPIDLHTHIRTLPQEIEYVYYLKLAMGVTTMVNAAGRG